MKRFWIILLLANSQWLMANSQQPGTRWWWLGSAVDSAGITYQFESLSKAGIGAVEITPIYGVQGNEANDILFLSPRWMEMLGWCETEGARLGIQIDMNNGTGWPFGGPEITPAYAAKKAVFHREGDSIRLEIVPTRQKVKRAAPGGEGFVLDHFNREAVEFYLSKFDSAFARSGVPYPATFFNDSYEVYGADWTPALLEEFERRRGYRLQDHFATFLNEQAPGHADILCDYRETLGELLMENFAEPWVNWCHSHGALVRNQSHGSPANLLDMYAAVDIPEIEGFGLSDFGIKGLRTDSLTRPNYSDLSMLKYPASVAHFYGKPLVTAETFTWLTEHWRTSLSQCKPDFDLMMVAGVNRCYFHGTAYSPETAPWPGYLFYAAIEMNPQNTIWRDVPAFTAYMQRVQSALQEGQPDNDLLVYLPVYDIWSEYPGRLLLFDIHKMDQVAPRFIHAVNAIYNAGYDPDYVSDRMIDSIRGVNAEGRLIAPSGITYKALVLPEVNRLPLRTMQRVSALAAQGATVIYVGGYPQQLPGWGRQHTQSMRDEFADAEADLPTRLNKEYRVFRHGKGRVVVAKDYSQFAKLCPDLQPETMKKSLGLKTIRRRTDKGYRYFITNLQPKAIHAYIHPAVTSDSVLLSLHSGESCLLDITEKGCKIERLSLAGPVENSKIKNQQSKILNLSNLDWTITPVDIRSFSSSPLTAHRSPLQYWSDIWPDAVGTMAYETTIQLPRKPHQAVLRLGDVRESARVYVNGRDAGVVFAAPFEIDITPYLRRGKNSLRIEVTSLAANYLAEMDRRGIIWRKFKNANIANLKGGKVSYYGNWDVMPCGLNSAELLLDAPSCPAQPSKPVKYVHISFDDVTLCMEDIAADSTRYRSIFEQPFFGYLKQLHDTYGCAFSLYLFAKNKGFALEQFPQCYRQELTANSSWLKFGYHAYYKVKHASTFSDSTICAWYDYCNAQIHRFASPANRTHSLRLHNFYGDSTVVRYLHAHGTDGLLCADDTRRSYDLDSLQNDRLLRDDQLTYNGVRYRATNIRLERTSTPESDALNYLQTHDTLCVFTHEKVLDQTKLTSLIQTLSQSPDFRIRYITEL